MFVGNLNFDTTADELRATMSEAGQIEDVFLPKDRATGRPRGFAFVKFSTPEEASAAIEKFNGFELAGRALNVNPAEDRPRRRPPSPPPYQGGGGFDNEPSFGGFGGGGGGDRPAKPKGSRRGLRGKKRSL